MNRCLVWVDLFQSGRFELLSLSARVFFLLSDSKRIFEVQKYESAISKNEGAIAIAKHAQFSESTPTLTPLL